MYEYVIWNEFKYNVLNMKILCILSLSLSIVAICFACVRTEPFMFVDNAFVGFILTALSIAVTFSVGFQVLQAISVVRKVDAGLKETDLRIKNIESSVHQIVSDKIEKRIEAYDHTVSALIHQMYTILTYYKGFNYEEAFIGFMHALEEAIKGDDQKCIMDIVAYIEDVVQSINKYYCGQTSITDSKMSEFIKIVSQVDDEVSIKLIKEISKFKTTSH